MKLKTVIPLILLAASVSIANAVPTPVPPEYYETKVLKKSPEKPVKEIVMQQISRLGESFTFDWEGGSISKSQGLWQMIPFVTQIKEGKKIVTFSVGNVRYSDGNPQFTLKTSFEVAVGDSFTVAGPWHSRGPRWKTFTLVSAKTRLITVSYKK